MASKTGSMFTYAFQVDAREREDTSIRIYGLDKNNQSICLHVSNFRPFVMIELPKLPGRMKWDRRLAETTLTLYLAEKLGESQKPLKTRFVYRKKLYSAQTRSDGTSNKFPFLWCMFAVRSHIIALKKLLYSDIKIPRIPGTLRLKLHEANADEILQLVCTTNIPTAGWINYSGVVQKKRSTRASSDISVSYANLKPYSNKNSVNPMILSFDIEAYSHAPGKFPDAGHQEDKVFMISCVFFRDDGDGFSREVLLTLGNPRDEDVGAECIRFRTEGELIEGFSKIIQEMNPQIITGWNILRFDIEYLISRSKITGDYDQLGLAGMHKSRGHYGDPKEINWSSSAYGNQKIKYLEWEGRVIIDLLPFVKRDHKLDNYKLDTVGKHFLGGDGKEDLSANELFKCYDVGIKDKKNINTPKARKSVGIAGKYCMVDSKLVARLFRKTQAWIGLSEMASTCNVPMFDLIARGQQKRVFSQVYKYCQENAIVVESEGYRAGENERYVGAYVFEPAPGVYDNIVPFDFASLYPTTIIAYNIDYSTLVKDNRIPDSKCNVIEWEDHLGCEHDPKVKRVNELNTLIDSREKDMKKLRTKRDQALIVDYLPGYSKGKKYTSVQRKGAKLLRDRERKKISRKLKKMESELKPYREERAEIKKSIPKMHMCASRKYRFLKEPKGVIPTVLQNLLSSRKETRALKRKKEEELENIKSDKKIKDMKVLINVLEQRQKAKKVCANSMYGAMGVRDGYLPFMPGAMCTTAMGRRNNKLAAKTIVDKFDGKLVYGDTDSEYVFFPHLHDSSKSRSENAAVLWDHCLKVAAEVTKLYPAPMKLEFEEEIYHRFLILSKKRYMYRTMKREGIVKNKVGNKGVLLSRRDNSNVVRDVYAGLVERVFDRKTESEILDWLMDKILEMFHRKVDADKFTITKAVGGVGNLPLINDVNIQWIKRIESGEENQSTEVLEKLARGKVVVGDYTIPILSKEPVERARQMKMKEASNAIEYYTHCLPAHVALAMKMKSRGTRVDDGTRLEHLVTVGNGHKGKLFSKVEDVNYYKRHSAYLKIDKLYYLKAMTTPIDQVLRACFGMKYFMKNLYKHWLNREKVLESLVAKPNIIFE